MKPQFYGVIERASNIGCEVGNYTTEMFQADFPQFYSADGSCWIPDAILEGYLTMVNSSIQPDKWLESWRYAAGLYAAHMATMYLRSAKGPSASASAAAASGEVIGTIKSASLGDASVSYDDGAAIAGTQNWGILNTTSYGQQLASLAKLIGMGGSYVL